MSDVSQVERQLYILSLLSENKRGYTIEDLMNSLHRVGIDVSRKTVERDIDYITANFFVYEEEKNNKTYYIADKYNVENISFTITELISLYFAQEVLKSYSTLDVGSAAYKLISRFITNTPKLSRIYIDTLKDMIKITISDIGMDIGINEEYLQLIKDAIADKKSIVVEYHAFNSNEITSRKFNPYLLEIKEGCYHVVGYCHMRKAERDLRVSRIKSVVMTKDTFTRPENFYENYKRKCFNMLSSQDKIKLKLKFRGDAARFVTEYEKDKADSIKELGEGFIIFERETTMTPEITKWVLGFGAQVEVIEPTELREEIQNVIKEMQKNYI